MPANTVKPTKNYKVVLLGAAIFVLAGVGSGYFFSSVKTQDTSQTNTQQAAFSFDAAKAPTWHSAGNNWPSGEDASQGSNEPLPIVNMNISSGTSQKPGTCFAMFFYKAGKANETVAINDLKMNSIKGLSNIAFDETGVSPLEIATSEGAKKYHLHQFAFSGAGSASMAKGVQRGYVQLKAGYIEIQGICEQADQLQSTVPAIQAVGFDL
jgi:hypothetical protein